MQGGDSCIKKKVKAEKKKPTNKLPRGYIRVRKKEKIEAQSKDSSADLAGQRNSKPPSQGKKRPPKKKGSLEAHQRHQ